MLGLRRMFVFVKLQNKLVFTLTRVPGIMICWAPVLSSNPPAICEANWPYVKEDISLFSNMMHSTQVG